MSRTPKINPALVAMDAEIANARQHRQALEGDAVRARQLVDALVAARERMEAASLTRASRSAKPWKPRGAVEKAIVERLGNGTASAEALRTATGAAPASLRQALARMIEAKAVVLVDDRYSLAGSEIAEAAQ